MLNNYVYHGTPLGCLDNILRFDCLFGMTEIIYNGKKYRGVSTTRNYNYAKNLWRSIKLQSDKNKKYWAILILDLDKIKYNHKTLPLNYDMWHFNKFYKDESEEFIFGRLYPLSKYLVDIERC